MAYYHERNSQYVIEDSFNRRLQDEIDILDGNCSFDVDVIQFLIFKSKIHTIKEFI